MPVLSLGPLTLDCLYAPRASISHGGNLFDRPECLTYVIILMRAALFDERSVEFGEALEVAMMNGLVGGIGGRLRMNALEHVFSESFRQSCQSAI